MITTERYCMWAKEVAELATGRHSSLFKADVQQRRGEIAELLGGKRVLVIGGAGSIGAATVGELAAYQPQALHVVDLNENGLTELVRDLRSRSAGLTVPDFRTLPLDFGSTIMQRFLTEQEPYDVILNFAALKHVRSEKDVYSLAQMLDTNLVKQMRFMRWLAAKDGVKRYFCVSTDKAANPVNLMGASKRLMEKMLFSGVYLCGLRAEFASARFANVAYSDGSLLYSFARRLEKRQPLALPRNTRRYFVSIEEAAHICLLGAICAPPQHILIPRLDPAQDLRDLQFIAEGFVAHFGFKPKIYTDEQAAKRGVESDMAAGSYPLLLTSLDTVGEKPFEEFVGPGEVPCDIGLPNLLSIAQRSDSSNRIKEVLSRVERFVSGQKVGTTKEEVLSWVAEVIPHFRHIETGKHLDQRM
jgi:FlaA1/EpsC-like NDP-sugar epimerase